MWRQHVKSFLPSTCQAAALAVSKPNAGMMVYNVRQWIMHRDAWMVIKIGHWSRRNNPKIQMMKSSPVKRTLWMSCNAWTKVKLGEPEKMKHLIECSRPPFCFGRFKVIVRSCIVYSSDLFNECHDLSF